MKKRLWWLWWDVRYWAKRRAEALLMWTANRMPRKLRYWTTVMSCAEATTGRYSNTVVTDLSITDMLKRIDPYPQAKS